MFEEAENDPVMSEKEFARREPDLRDALLTAQSALRETSDRALLVVVGGIDGAGKGAAISLLSEWMNPRDLRIIAFGEPRGDELLRPPMWRYWNELPPRGSIGVVFGSWYGALVREASRKHPDQERVQRLTEEIRHFEAMLAAEGVQLLKLWFHLSRDAQQQRCEVLAADPDTAWRVSEEDLLVAKHYPTLRAGAQTVVEATAFPFAPWTVIPSADPSMRAWRTATAVRDALRRRKAPRPEEVEQPLTDDVPERLASADYTVRLDKKLYESQLAHWQGRLARAVHHPDFAKRSLVAVFEGNDAAGKGGAIRRLTHALDIRQTRIVGISAPTPEALARPYLWRFWREIPILGRIVVFDRSWYGRVLVERVEKFARPAEWRRAYGEVRDFESQLTDHGAIVIKFWLAITKEEQLARFQAREAVPFKRYKITQEDWRNREKWDAYRVAANDMFAHTDTPAAPWVLVASDDKRHARVEVVKAVALAVEKALGISGKK